ARVLQVEGGMIEVIGVERLLAERDAVVAQGLHALGTERAYRARDLGGVAGVGLAREQRAVAGQGLALGGGEPIVVPQVLGGGGDTVDGAAGEQERVERAWR